MKTFKKVFFIATVSLFVISCSDKLSESKVEKLINECTEKEPKYGKAHLNTGKLSYLSEKNIELYKSLESKGLVKIEETTEKNGYFTNKYHIISLTEKAKPFIIETKESGFSDNKINVIKLYTLKADEIGNIVEIPSFNAAEVKVTFKKEDKTPFYDVLTEDKTDFEVKKITLRKTENNGWMYCDK